MNSKRKLRQYRKEFISKNYDSSNVVETPNRAKKREPLQKQRFKSNKKGISLTRYGVHTFRRVVDRVMNDDGSIKNIHHYILNR